MEDGAKKVLGGKMMKQIVDEFDAESFDLRRMAIESVVAILEEYVEVVGQKRQETAVADVLEAAGKMMLETASVKVTLAQVGY